MSFYGLFAYIAFLDMSFQGRKYVILRSNAPKMTHLTKKKKKKKKTKKKNLKKKKKKKKKKNWNIFVIYWY